MSALYERFRRPLHFYIYRLLGSQEDADDVTQEVFVRVFTAWDGLHDRDNLSAWLYRIATNLSIDLLRRRKRISWWSLTSHTDGDEGFFLPPDDGGIAEIAEREHIRPPQRRCALAQAPPASYKLPNAAWICHCSPGKPWVRYVDLLTLVLFLGE